MNNREVTKETNIAELNQRKRERKREYDGERYREKNKDRPRRAFHGYTLVARLMEIKGMYPSLENFVTFVAEYEEA